MSESFKDRRKFVRIYRNFILSYHEKGKSTQRYDISQLNNVSKGGMNFIATRAFEQGTEIVIDLKTPFISDSVHLEGVVLESREKISKMLYDIRLQFNNLSAEALEVLDRIENYTKAEG